MKYEEHMLGLYRRIVPQKARVRIRCLLGKSYYDELNHSTRTIFIHVPKTAGSSISQAIYGDMTVGHQHFLAREYYYESKKLFNSYFKFAFVRNPISRFISSYKYYSNLPEWVGKETREFAEENVLPYKNINGFIDYFFSSRITREWKHFLPQVEFVLVNDELAMDFVGKLERIEQDIEKLFRMLNINESKLPHVNKSQRMDTLRLLPDKVRLNKLIDYYDRDFYCFGYSSRKYF